MHPYPVPARRRGRRARAVGRVALAAMPLYTFGLLGFAPFAAVAARTRRVRDWAVAAGYAAATAVWVALPDGQDGVGTAIALALMFLGPVHAYYLLSRADADGAHNGAQYPDTPRLDRSADQHAALTAAHLAAWRRARARDLLARQPALGFQLRIGRPDLPRDYDDGGLLDVNHLSAETLADRLRLTPDEARAVVEARDQLGGFESSADLITYANLEPHRVDVLREFLVFPRA